jgi:hypothetical protein
MLDRLSGVAGAALRGLFSLMLLVRRPRPIHSRGVVLEGGLTWIGGTVESGIRWIDDAPPSPVPVVARLSRSVGLPPALPDIIGLALRCEADGRPVDVELATTGIGVPSRFFLLPHRSPSRGTYGSLLPYRSTRGPVLLCARGVSGRMLPAGVDEIADALRAEPWTIRLYFATPTGKWHPFAQVDLRTAAQQDDRDLRFDAVRHPLPGAGTYRWVERLRQPSYLRVQGVR